MHRTFRIRFLLLVLFVAVAANLARQGYRWIAYGDERAELRRLTEELDSSGLQVVRTSVEAARLRSEIEAADALLAEQREALARVESRAANRRVPPTLYDDYSRALERYNRGVDARNTRFEAWRTVLAENHDAVERYNATADSMRSVGIRMKEPYLEVPSPAEVAARHGFDPDSSAARSPDRPEG